MKPADPALDRHMFMSTLTAAATHDLKNFLAIINENAGLLEDLCQMAETGRPLTPERTLAISGKIKHQVQRSDQVLKHLNRLAHFSDAGQSSCDLETTARIVFSLSNRLIDTQGVTLQILPPQAPVHAATSPFGAAYLIFRGLQAACQAAGRNATLTVSFSGTPVGICFGLPKDALNTAEYREAVAALEDLAAGSDVRITQKEPPGLALEWPVPEPNNCLP